jgi:NTP pyrophosphatase (non-canonical NTP hydrolase)
MITAELTNEEVALVMKVRDGRSRFVQVSDLMLDDLSADWSKRLRIKIDATDGPVLQLIFQTTDRSLGLRDMQERALLNANEKGFTLTEEDTPRCLMLIVTELAEAMEDYRKPANPAIPLRQSLQTVHFENGGKPCGFPSELADAIIRIGHLAAFLGIDLSDEVERKMAYNATRPFLHGNKRA